MGSGDLLRERGYGDPDSQRIRFQLADAIALSIEDCGLGRAGVCRLTGLRQLGFPKILNGNADGFSTMCLQALLKALAKDWKVPSSAEGQTIAQGSGSALFHAEIWIAWISWLSDVLDALDIKSKARRRTDSSSGSTPRALRCRGALPRLDAVAQFQHALDSFGAYASWRSLAERCMAAFR